jgi:predicted RNA-binding Zn-ribbon protein involved in translation (DUF1610 family)
MKHSDVVTEECPECGAIAMSVENLKEYEERMEQIDKERREFRDIKERDAKIWNEKCPNCGSTDMDWDLEGNDPASSLIIITCNECDATFEVVEDKRYYLQRYTDEPGGD